MNFHLNLGRVLKTRNKQDSSYEGTGFALRDPGLKCVLGWMLPPPINSGIVSMT